MRIAVLGASGMLGHKLVQVLSKEHEVCGTVRKELPLSVDNILTEEAEILMTLDTQNIDEFKEVLESIEPEVIINAIGVVKQSQEMENLETVISTNSLFPHQLSMIARDLDSLLIHISTDCVFSGRKGFYATEDIPDPVDTYSLTKLLGEPANEDHVLVLRTSMIGRELFSSHGLLEWFLSQESDVKGFTRVNFSGPTSLEIAQLIGEILKKGWIDGIWHLGVNSIDKNALLRMLNKVYSKDILIRPDSDLKLDRSLNSNPLYSWLGRKPKSWHKLITEMVEDKTPYEQIRNK